MLNYLWGFMLLIGVCFGIITGQMEAVTNGALDSAKDAVTLCITMLGVMSLWTGLLEVAKRGGLLAKMTKLLSPFIQWIFPLIPDGHPARDSITANFIANILGLGWAATPAGLKAMEELSDLEKDRQLQKIQGPVRKAGVASNEMCNFLILNISSLQLLPVTIIAYRSQYGSANPASIIVPSIIATAASTIAAICFIKFQSRKEVSFLNKV